MSWEDTWKNQAQQDPNAAVAVYAMAAHLVAARIATGEFGARPGDEGIAIAVQRQAAALAAGADLPPLGWLVDRTKHE